MDSPQCIANRCGCKVDSVAGPGGRSGATQVCPLQEPTSKFSSGRPPQSAHMLRTRRPVETEQAAPPSIRRFTSSELHDLADAIERYYYYVEVGISTRNIAPFRESWIENVLSLLPAHRMPNLQEDYYQQLLEDAVDEMKADYIFSMRKAIMHYVIRSPVERWCAALRWQSLQEGITVLLRRSRFLTTLCLVFFCPAMP
jgi:hypothetical protein